MDPANTALLVVDVQQGLFKKTTPIYKSDDLQKNINSVIDRTHQAGVPVFYFQHSDMRSLRKGSLEWQLHPELKPLRQDYLIHKRLGNAFEETNLSDILNSKNITNLVVTGLVTHGCVRATCMGARHLGYKVILVKDGHSNYSKQASKLIDEWNLKLSALQIELLLASEIKFSCS